MQHSSKDGVCRRHANCIKRRKLWESDKKRHANSERHKICQRHANCIKLRTCEETAKAVCKGETHVPQSLLKLKLIYIYVISFVETVLKVVGGVVCSQLFSFFDYWCSVHSLFSKLWYFVTQCNLLIHYHPFWNACKANRAAMTYLLMFFFFDMVSRVICGDFNDFHKRYCFIRDIS